MGLYNTYSSLACVSGRTKYTIMIAINKNIVIKMLGNRNANCVKNSIEYPEKENNYGF